MQNARATLAEVVGSINRPYPVTLSMVVLVLLVPVYLFIPDLTPVQTFATPKIALDDAFPVVPAWSLVYGALYSFLILLPVLVVHQQEHIRRTVRAYLFIWLTAYAVFLLYPTAAPRPLEVLGEGFAAWGLRALYDSDPPYNCFPSLHVAHSFVSALTCLRVHRGVGIFATICALLVGLSTLFTKQHYVVDVIAGIALAGIACALFLRRVPGSAVSEQERRVAPHLVAGNLGLMLFGVGIFYVIHRMN